MAMEFPGMDFAYFLICAARSPDFHERALAENLNAPQRDGKEREIFRSLSSRPLDIILPLFQRA